MNEGAADVGMALAPVLKIKTSDDGDLVAISEVFCGMYLALSNETTVAAMLRDEKPNQCLAMRDDR